MQLQAPVNLATASPYLIILDDVGDQLCERVLGEKYDVFRQFVHSFLGP